jgi:hypothetical protein
VAQIGADVSEECVTSIIKVKRINELGTTKWLLVTVNFVPSSLIRFTLMMEAMRSSKAPDLK